MCPIHSFDRVALPQPLQRAGRRLAGHALVGVAGGFGQDVAVGDLKSEIRMTKTEFVHTRALSAGGHALVRQHPVVQRRFVAVGQSSPASYPDTQPLIRP